MKRIVNLSASVLSLALAQAMIPAAYAGNAAELAQQVAQEKAKTNIYQAKFPSLELAHKAAISFHANLLEANYETGYMVFELNPEEKSKLERFGFVMTVATDFINKRNAMLDRIHAPGNTATLLGKNATVITGAKEQSIPSYPCYETVEETFAAAQGFTTTYPNLATWKSIGKSWEMTNGLGGYNISVLKLTNSAIPGPKPILFVQSAMHAREYTTAPIVLQFARDLLTGYGTNADATWILDNHEVHLLLHLNPDGRKKAESGLLWRKNTNQNYCGATSSSRGADLNRNFSATWNTTNDQGSSSNECDETYRGPTPASEPETQAVQAYVRSLWVDNRGPNPGDPAPSNTSGVHMDIHSYSQLVLWPYGNTSTPAPNGTAMQTMGRRLAYFNGYTPEQSIGLYPTDGTSDDVSYVELGVASFTIELGTSFFESCSSYTGSTRPKNLPALWYAAKVARTPYLTPAGPDVSTPTFVPSADTTPVSAGTSLTVNSVANNTHFNQSNGTEPTPVISGAEYYVDTPPWATGAIGKPLTATDGAFNSTNENVTGTINTTGLSNGKHIVYVRAKVGPSTWGPVSAQFIQIGTGPSIPPLSNGVAVTNLSVAKGGQKLYTFTVPAGSTSLKFATSGGTGDVDLYIGLGSAPTTSSYLKVSDGSTTSESISITNPTAGVYYVLLNGYAAASGFQVVATYK